MSDHHHSAAADTSASSVPSVDASASIHHVADASASAPHAAVFDHVASFFSSNTSYVLLAQQDQHHHPSKSCPHHHHHHSDPSAPIIDPAQPSYPPPSYGSINTASYLERQAIPIRGRPNEQPGALEPSVSQYIATLIPLLIPVLLMAGAFYLMLLAEVSPSEPPWRSP